MNTDTPATQRPKVLIVGGGLGGLMLGILLEKAGVPYEILERTHDVKQLGSSVSLNANILYMFKQIGIYDEFVAISSVCMLVDVYNEKRELEFSLDYSGMKEIGGIDTRMASRPDLYDLLIKQIPPQKIHMGKRVLSTEQGGNGVMVRCGDKSTYEGDILVGADGAYSSIRQCMYQNLKKRGRLLSSDDKPIPFTSVCMLGQTRPLDPSKFTHLNDAACRFSTVIATNRSYSWSTFSLPDNTYCWAVAQNLDTESSKDYDNFRSSEWGTETSESMCQDVYNFPIPGGVDGKLTIGTLIDSTPKELISKVMQSEKVFETWYSERTVLMGDACHMVHPAANAGAVNAMQDAVVLANWINTLSSTKLNDIEKVFKEYKAERFVTAKATFHNGHTMAKIVGNNVQARFIRTFFRNIPSWLWKIIMKKMSESRLQVSFLPLVKDQGSIEPIDQPSLRKTLKIIQDQREV
ncbi:hypothetical protein BG011_004572 [Mortierella polycephala]|uniref:FAD-binding domain-containing protein n=1 Tax=Mortierella polycephala TaxID=41804 RepID=A0A9P6U1G1_9FUNG|nr:hypothetical protein BG011_004572 [Mortierella polycephala]